MISPVVKLYNPTKNIISTPIHSVHGSFWPDSALSSTALVSLIHSSPTFLLPPGIFHLLFPLPGSSTSWIFYNFLSSFRSWRAGRCTPWPYHLKCPLHPDHSFILFYYFLSHLSLPGTLLICCLFSDFPTLISAMRTGTVYLLVCL